jgi:cytochrome b6-f complex iron-sulfur subunit
MPKKKDRETTGLPEAPSTRRGFLLKLWFGLGLVALGELIWLVVSFLRPRSTPLDAGDFGTLIEAGSVETFARNSVTAFPRGHFYLARLEDGGFLAIHRRCTHLGCTVPWLSEEKKFVCPCHSSAFDIRGEVIRAPAPRALDIFPITIENKVVRVDTRKPIKRGAFKPEQAVYSEKTS